MEQPPDKLLILDLDETLVFASEDSLGRRPDFEAGPYLVYKRPHVDALLTACLRWFRVAVWSSSSPLYCQAIVNALFGDPGSLAFVWASDRCTRVFNPECGEPYWRKNIRKVERLGYSTASIIAVDDTPRKWEKSYGNLVAIQPYTGDETDAELLKLLAYLGWLRHQPDVRKVEKRTWWRHLSGPG